MRAMVKFGHVLILGCCILSACTPVVAPLDVQAAVASTLEAKSSPHALASDPISTPAGTATATATQTLLPTPSATTEALMIRYDMPGRYLLSSNDCRPEDGYYVPKNGYTPVTNQEVRAEMGTRAGRKYVVETARVTGWKVEYLNDSNRSKPRRIVAEAEMHQHPEGAELALSLFNPMALNQDDGWRLTENNLPAGGNETVFLRVENEDTADETWQTHIAFIYNNYLLSILAEGMPAEIDMDFLGQLVAVTRLRLEQETLYPVALAPTPIRDKRDEEPLTINPRDLVLVESDLPLEGGYKSSRNLDQTMDNSETIQSWGIDLGREYVIGTGREIGHRSRFYSYDYRNRFWSYGYRTFDDFLQNKSVDLYRRDRIIPDYVECQVIRYQSSDGARDAMRETRQVIHPTSEGWEILPGYDSIGDQSVMLVDRTVLSTGEVYAYYDLILVYRNYLVDISGAGYEFAVEPAFVVSLADIVLAKFETAPSLEP